MTPAPNDLDLLRRYAEQRDADAFAALCRRHAPMVFAAARRVTGSAHDAEDVAQSCFLELARRADEVRSSLAGWLHTLAVNRARNTMRNQAVRWRHENHAAQLDLRGDRRDEPTWNEIAPLIDSAINDLPEELRTPLVLHYLHDFNQVQIAQELGISQPTVSRRIQGGIEQLRRTLAARGVAPSIAGLSLALPLASARGQEIPATLRAALGKMAVAGIGPPLKTAAGAWSIKWIALAAIGGLLAVIAGWQIAAALRAPPPIPQQRNTLALVQRDGERVWIERVPELVWGAGNSGQRTMLGALCSASRVTDRPIDYNTLIGDSGLAFRVRWQPITSAAVDPYRLAHPTDAGAIAALQEAMGMQLHVRGEFGPRRTRVDELGDQIIASINAGLPVISEDQRDHEFAVIFGYDGFDQQFLLRSYPAPPWAVAGDGEVGGGLIFLGRPLEKRDRRQAVVIALRRAVDWWNHPPQGDMLLGDSAFIAWQEAYHCDHLPYEVQYRIWRQSWWNYDLLCDGHYHAAIYLRRHAGFFEPGVRDALLAAAEHFDSLEKDRLVDSVYRKSEGPFTNKTFEDWDRSRPQGIDLIREAHRRTAAAVERLAEAVRKIERDENKPG